MFLLIRHFVYPPKRRDLLLRLEAQSCSTPRQHGGVCERTRLSSQAKDHPAHCSWSSKTQILALSIIHWGQRQQGPAPLPDQPFNYKHIKTRHTECRMDAHYAEWAESPEAILIRTTAVAGKKKKKKSSNVAEPTV